jgi:hypothetical protein
VQPRTPFNRRRGNCGTSQPPPTPGRGQVENRLALRDRLRGSFHQRRVRAARMSKSPSSARGGNGRKAASRHANCFARSATRRDWAGAANAPPDREIRCAVPLHARFFHAAHCGARKRFAVKLHIQLSAAARVAHANASAYFAAQPKKNSPMRCPTSWLGRPAGQKALAPSPNNPLNSLARPVPGFGCASKSPPTPFARGRQMDCATACL